MIEIIKNLCLKAIIDENFYLHKQIELKDINISKSNNIEIGHFQFNNIMKMSKDIKENNIIIAKKLACKISTYIKNDEFSINITQPGFINFKLNDNYLNYKLKTIFKNLNFKIKNTKKKKIIIDYSSPNIAKNMHVGHLRSTLIGECLSKILILFKHDVIKISHLGDWGTQFGILIQYIKKKFKKKIFYKMKLTLNKLSYFYKVAQKKYIENKTFKNLAKKKVINLQKKKKDEYEIWKVITKISKKEYKKIYKLLKIKIIYKGESFYSDLLIPLIKYIKNKKLIIKSDNASCINIDGLKNKDGKDLPIIVQKSDGGFNYMMTDIAAIYYRIKYNKPNIILYITDIGQKDHFEILFKITKKLELNKKNIELIHIPFGLMLTETGKKIKTRSGMSEKLIDLIKKSIKLTHKITKNSKKKSKIIGLNTIIYAELSNKIEKNYIFNYNTMLKYNGKTATFIMYAYARIESIFKKLKEKINFNNKIKIENKIELDFAIHLLTYQNSIEQTMNNLNPNIIAIYTYELAEKFHSFFQECNITKSELKYSRLNLCNITKKVLKNCFNLMGLSILKKM